MTRTATADDSASVSIGGFHAISTLARGHIPAGDKIKTVWHGYYVVQVVDHFTHAPIATLFINASRQESDAYPEVFERSTANLGDIKPLAVAGDRGFSLSKIFAFNTDRGVASVFP